METESVVQNISKYDRFVVYDNPFYKKVLGLHRKQQKSNLKLRVMAYVINEDCTACGTCIDECPVDAISEGDIYKIDPEVCTDCGSCADVCPVEAIEPE